jgi:hypothetical protein
MKKPARKATGVLSQADKQQRKTNVAHAMNGEIRVSDPKRKAWGWE